MATKEEFGMRLAKLRTAANISAREMSLAIGQNASYINRIENNKAYPSMEVFFYICEYLKISPADFFDDRVAYPKKVESFCLKVQNMPLRQLKLLELVADEFLVKKK